MEGKMNKLLFVGVIVLAVLCMALGFILVDQVGSMREMARGYIDELTEHQNEIERLKTMIIRLNDAAENSVDVPDETSESQAAESHPTVEATVEEFLIAYLTYDSSRVGMEKRRMEISEVALDGTLLDYLAPEYSAEQVAEGVSEASFTMQLRDYELFVQSNQADPNYVNVLVTVDYVMTNADGDAQFDGLIHLGMVRQEGQFFVAEYDYYNLGLWG